MIVIRCMMKDETEDQYQTALNLANFPASFSVSLNDHVSCDGIEFRKLPDGVSCSRVRLSQRPPMPILADPQNWNDI